MVIPALIGGAALLGSAYLGKKSSEYAVDAQTEASREQREWADKRYDLEQRHILGEQDYSRALGEGGIGVDQIGRERDVKQSGDMQRQAFDIGIEEYGMTPQEIAGSPVPGGVAQSGGGAALGNQTSQLAGQRAAAQERAADRELTALIESERNKTALTKTAMEQGINVLGQSVQARGQDIAMSQTELQSATSKYISELQSQTNIITTKMSSDAQVAASSIIADATKYSADQSRLNALGQLRLAEKIGDLQMAKLTAETATIMQTKQFEQVLHDERWEKLFSSMGAENVVTSALAIQYDIDIEDTLKGKATPEQIKQLKVFSDAVLGRGSYFQRELMGMASSAQDILNMDFNKGNLLSSQPPTLGGTVGSRSRRGY